MITALLMILIWAVFLAIVGAVAFWLMAYLGWADPMLRKIVGAILLLIFLIIVLMYVSGHGPVLWTTRTVVVP